MPRNQGTSRKGKPKKLDRQAGMGRALQRATEKRYRPKSNGSSRNSGGGMAASGAQSIGIAEVQKEMEQKKMLSVLEMDDLSDFLTQAEMANRDFISEREKFVVLDPTGSEYKTSTNPHTHTTHTHNIQFDDNHMSTNKKHNKVVSDEFLFQELSVPRRPAWDEDTTAEQLDQLEKESFLEWRRAIAQREDDLLSYYQQRSNSNMQQRTTVTPFEKNLQVWKQLWRVLERSQCIIQIVDGRNPLFYLSQDLRVYAENELNKPMLIVVNKCDFLTSKQRQQWHTYLTDHNIQHVFFSAYTEQQKLDNAAQQERKKLQLQLRSSYDDDTNNDNDNPLHNNNDDDDSKEEEEEVTTTTNEEEEEDVDSKDKKEKEEKNVGVKVPLSREELLDALEEFAVQQHGIGPSERYSDRIQYGLVGFPNVGKSSVINVLVGSSKHTHNLVRVGVASQPGKTKHFQTLLLPDRNTMMLCDCPGLVFPSFVSSSADLIAAGVFPIAQMRDFWPTMELICRRIPREIFNAQYGITLPTPSLQDLKEQGIYTTSSTTTNTQQQQQRLPPPTANELLDTFCITRSMLAPHSGVPDHQRASRLFIKDYVDGKLIYCHPPPTTTTTNDTTNDSMANVVEFHKETLMTAISRVDKLRHKLGILSLNTTNTNKQQDEKDSDKNDNSVVEGLQKDLDLKMVVVDDYDDDFDILDAVEGFATNNDGDGLLQQPNGGNRGKSHKSMQKWGKKGRKLRNKDPYGCHSQPDTEFQNSGGGGGVYAAGHDGGGSGYTRPTYGAPVVPDGGKKHRRRNKRP